MDQFIKDLINLQQDLVKTIAHDIPRSIGKEGEDYFRESFQKESFDGVKWKEVKRRMPNSRWFGFEYKGKGLKPFSPAATRRKILTGSTGDLAESITHRIEPGRVIFASDKPYAQVHNEGGHAFVFGKSKFTMPKRQFMGFSQEFDAQIDRIIEKRMDGVFKRNGATRE
ncbi:MAG: phage virion morphogenesis protein [Flavobacteriales bacterium]|nr:phage virion morphogenesis protein [Flavobacteriales bacterium]